MFASVPVHAITEDSLVYNHENIVQDDRGFFDYIFSIFKFGDSNNNNSQEYDPNAILKEEDVFRYVPGEIIIKLKNEYTLPITTDEIRELPVEVDVSNIDTEPVIPILEDKKQGKFINSYEDYVSVEKARIAGLDRMFSIDIPDLQRKSEIFIEKFEYELSKSQAKVLSEGTQENIIKVPTEEFGLVEIDISRHDYIIDPYTLQLLDELNSRQDIEYAEVNARFFIQDTIESPEAEETPNPTPETNVPDVFEIDIPVEVPEEEVVEVPYELPEITVPEDVVEDSEDKGILQNIIETIEDAIDVAVKPLDLIIKSHESTKPNDDLFDEQWSLNNTGQSFHSSRNYTSTGYVDADINFLETWQDTDYSKGAGVVVAVLDTGISYFHEELDDNLWINQNEIPSDLFTVVDSDLDGEVTSREILTYIENEDIDANSDGEYDFKDVLHSSSPFINDTDDDGNGYTDDILGYDFVSFEYNEDPQSDSGADNDPYDWHGHGTHVSGTIAAEENDTGIIGVAPLAKIMTARGLDSYGSGSILDLINGVYYIANNGADIINNSWGGQGSYQPLTDAFDYAKSMGVISVAASGNSHSNVKDFLPANIDSVISVGNYTAWNNKNSSSNWGSTLDIAAPGTSIISVLSEGSYFDNYYQDSVYNGYLIITGTSMASPHIAGMLAGIKSSSNIELTTERARNLLRLSERGIGYFTEEFGYGRAGLKKLFDLRDTIVPSANITSPENENSISGFNPVQADISGDYASSSVVVSGSVLSDISPVTTVCSGAVFGSCIIDTTLLKENKRHSLEIQLKNGDGDLTARDSVVVFVDNLELEFSDQKALYGKNDILSLIYKIKSNGEGFDYSIIARPESPIGEDIVLFEMIDNTQNVEDTLDRYISNLPGSGSYKIILEVKYSDQEGGINTVTEKANIYVDLGLKENFPVTHEIGKMISDIMPTQILDLDDSSEEKELYSPKNECEDLGGGFRGCFYKTEMWQLSSDGTIKDIMPDLDLENTSTEWNYVIGNASEDINHLDFKLYNISSEDGYSFTRDLGSVAKLSSDTALDWESEIEETFDALDDTQMILSEDMDGDGEVETVVMKNSPDYPWNESIFVKIYIFNSDGTEKSSFLASQDTNDDRVTQGMIIGNFDDETLTKEILITSTIPDCSGSYCDYYPPEGYLMSAFTIDGTLLWEKTLDGTEGSHDLLNRDGPYSVDIDNDNIDEIVTLQLKIKSNDYYSSSRWVLVNVYSNAGILIDSYKTPSSFSYDRTQKVVFGDIDSDGFVDALVTNGVYYTALTLDGGEKIFEKEISEPQYNKSHITIDNAMIADFNNDKNLEVMFVTSTRWGTYFGEPIPKTMRLFDDKGDEIINDNFPKTYPSLRQDIGEELDYTDVIYLSYPQISDLDSDGKLDLVFQSASVDGFDNTYYATEVGGNESSVQADGSYMLNPKRNGHFESLVPEVSVPTHITAVPQDEGAFVTWNQGQAVSEEVVGYNIYQSSSYDVFEGEPINKKLVEDVEYEVKKLDNGITYYFAITALDENGNESKLSDPIMVTPYQGPYMQFGDVKEIVSPDIAFYHGLAYANNKIVWVENVYPVSTLYMYDTISEEKKAIAAESEGDISSTAINSTTVVWSQYDSIGNEIYAYDIESEKITNVSSDVGGQSVNLPDISGRNIVFAGYIGSEYVIYLHNLDSGISEQISSGLSNTSNPNIHNTTVVWTNYNSGGKTDIYSYDLETQEQTKIVSDIDASVTLDLYGSVVVYAGNYGEEKRVRLYDLDSKTTDSIGYTNSEQSKPRIYNNKVIWQDKRNDNEFRLGTADVYVYDITTKNEYRISAQNVHVWNPQVYGDTMVWHTNDYANGGAAGIYMRKAYTVPGAPIDVIIDGEKRNLPKDIPQFEINWTNPFDPSGISGAWYKLGDAPESNTDGKYITKKPFMVTATEKNQEVHLWLENSNGHKDYTTHKTVVLKYHPKKEDKPAPKPDKEPKGGGIPIPPPAGGGGSRGGGGDTGGGGSNRIADAIKDIQKFFKSKDGTKVASEISSKAENGRIVETSVRSNISLMDNPADMQKISLDTSNTSVISEVTLDLPSNTLQELVDAFGASDDVDVTVTSKEAMPDQKTNSARKGLYLEGFDVFSIDMTIGENIIDTFSNPITLEFDVSSVDFEKSGLKMCYFDELRGTWERAGDGGVVKDGKLVVEVDHLTDFAIMRETNHQAPEVQDANTGGNGFYMDPALQWEMILDEANMVIQSGQSPENLQAFITHTSNTKDVSEQRFWMDTYTAPLAEGIEMQIQDLYSVNNFIVYGTSDTQNLGKGERAGVVSSYKQAYGKLPMTESEWRDAIAIAIGRWPNKVSLDAEEKGASIFEKIYNRVPNTENKHDNAAVTIMAYGLRNANRNLDTERATVKLFKDIFNYNPISTADWDIVRAISYSGATR